jgi:hypothetical protein
VNRDLLIGLAIGAGLSSLAYVVSSRLSPAPARPIPTATMRVFELSYYKPHAPVPAVYAGIPDPLTKQPSEAIVELASTCGVGNYTIENAPANPAMPVPHAALYIHPAKLSADAFDCLSDRVRPPYLTLKEVDRCRRLMDPNSGAPPCPVIIY